MAAQRILSAPHLTIVVDPIGTMPMEAGSGVMMVVVTIKLTIQVKNGT